jgi:hypothetical protein
MIDRMAEWMRDHQEFVWVLVGSSVGIFIVSVVVMPMILMRIHADYFAHETRPPSTLVNHSWIFRVAWRLVRNALGVMLMVGGLAMLVMPGQGLLTLLAGFLLVEFPGKYAWERWLMGRPVVLRPINWLRVRANRLPLIVR